MNALLTIEYPRIARIWSELQMRQHWCWERWPQIEDREAELY